jgi:atypical dual specificity phosphatase
MGNSDVEQVLAVAGGSVVALVVIFLITFSTGCAPRWMLSMESRLLRLCKRRKKWNWSVIEPGILLGALPRLPCHLEELKTEGVGAVLTLNEDWELSLSSRCVQDCNLVSRQLPTPDYFAPSQRDIVEAVSFMNNCIGRGVSVYVHCNGGKGRSAVCVICYLIYKHGWSPNEAFQYVRGKRKIASLKAWCGLHKQWRAVKRFARELKTNSKQAAYLAPDEIPQLPAPAPKHASAKVAPLQAMAAPQLNLVGAPMNGNGASHESSGQGPSGSSPNPDCEAQTN